MKHPLSRREFARGAACLAASASLLPALASAQTAPAPTPAPTSPPASSSMGAPPHLSAASQAEIEGKMQAILAKYGSRLSAAEKADIRRLLVEGQDAIEKFRAYPLDNADEPAPVFQPAQRVS